MSELVRANRVSVVSEGDAFIATFHRTHKKLESIASNQTGFIPDSKMNKVAQREAFRLFIIGCSNDLGIEYQPEDTRAESNKRYPKYKSDDDLIDDATKMIEPDITEFTEGCKIDGLELGGVEVDEIVPMTKSPKGKNLAELGIEEGKYGNGNWAWATIKMTATLKKDGNEGYVGFEMQLVSGQLKKPSKIDELGFTQTGFKTVICKDLGIETKKDDEIDENELAEMGVRVEG